MAVMPDRAPRICIVSTAHPSHNPRVVKEADALSGAGYRVRLVTRQHSALFAGWDEALLRRRAWTMRALPLQRSAALRVRRKLARRAAESLARVLGPCAGLAELTIEPLAPELFGLACLEPAELFIAHNLGALGPAAAAAWRFGAPFGFDAEDLHSGEVPNAERGSFEHRIARRLEGRYLPRARYVTAASAPIAERLVELYRIAPPTPVHNVFEWAERERLDGRRLDRRSDALSVCWFSQVVGLDRGLQDLIRAVGVLDLPVQVHIRGTLRPEVERELTQLARAVGAASALHFHPKVPPDELLSRVAEHDVGAALEVPVSENRRLTVTNKLFVYALAGLSLLATDTPGQRSVMQQMPGAGALYAPGDHQALASHLRALIESPERLSAQRARALEHARRRFCWEVEQRALLDRIDRALARS